MISYLENIQSTIARSWQGFLVSLMLAIAALFISEHYGAPAMLMALLFGIAFHFLFEEGKCRPGIEFTSKFILRVGVALLGVRISVELILGLGFNLLFLVIIGVILTIFFGLLGARFLNQNWRLGLLTGGSVAICGASAAMAISAVLPKNEDSERNLIFTVLSVTVLSTVAMILYPILTQYFGWNHHLSGVFLGGAIHDVAQVVGAGFSISPETGDVATLVKLIRVSMLAPVVLVISLTMRQQKLDGVTSGKKPPLLPTFVIGFIILAVLNSIGLIPEFVADFFSTLSRWLLLISIAAVGMKTSIKSILNVGGAAIALIVAETIFIAVFVMSGVFVIG